MVFAAPENCPGCGTPVEGDPWCAACGLELGGSEADAIRALAARLVALDTQVNALLTQREALSTQREALSTQLMNARLSRRPNLPPIPDPVPASRPAPFAPPPVRPPAEWTVERVRNFLLWAGAALLALSALAFTAVAWTHLGPVGRATLLVAFTVVAAFGASGSRQHLPATSGALTGLTIALSLVDWQIARRAGVTSDLSGATSWAIGTAVVTLLAYGLSRVASQTPARRAIAMLAPASAVLGLASSTGAPWSIALGLSLLAAALVACNRAIGARAIDPVIGRILAVEATMSWIFGAMFALVAAFESSTFAATLAPAGAMATLAIAPAVALVGSPKSRDSRSTMAVGVIGAFGAAALTLASTSVGAIGLATFAAAVAAAGIAVAPACATDWRRAAQIAAPIAAVPGLAIAGVASSTAALGPAAWFGHAWTGAMRLDALGAVAGPNTRSIYGIGWCAVAVLAVVAASVPFAVRSTHKTRSPANAIEWCIASVGVAFLALNLVPLAAGATALVACITATAAFAVAVVGAAVVARRHPDRAPLVGLVAVLPAVPAAGWAVLTPAASIVVIGVAIVSALVAIAVGRVASLRAAHAALAAAAAALLAGVVALAAGTSGPAAGFAGGVVGGIVLVIGAQLRWGDPDGVALEVVGLGALGTGLIAAGAAPAWLAGTLTCAVPLFLVASLRNRRSTEYGVAAGAAALGAVWAWLAAAGIHTVEAYTVPAAVAALGAAVVAGRVDPGGLGSQNRPVGGQSWTTVGPALALALGPTLVLAIGRRDDGRAIAVGLAALAVLLVGAQLRLQSPIVLGAISLLVLGVDKLGPQAARMPRWIMLAVAGSILLWVGTTFERRREDVQRVARSFERFG